MRSIRTRLRAQTYTSAWNLVCTRHRHAGWLNELTNYEKEGVPDGNAAVDSNNGWDLVRGVVCVSVCVCVTRCFGHRQGRDNKKEETVASGRRSLPTIWVGSRRSRSRSLARSLVRSPHLAGCDAPIAGCDRYVCRIHESNTTRLPLTPPTATDCHRLPLTQGRRTRVCARFTWLERKGRGRRWRFWSVF